MEGRFEPREFCVVILSLIQPWPPTLSLIPTSSDADPDPDLNLILTCERVLGLAMPLTFGQAKRSR